MVLCCDLPKMCSTASDVQAQLEGWMGQAQAVREARLGHCCWDALVNFVYNPVYGHMRTGQAPRKNGLHLDGSHNDEQGEMIPLSKHHLTAYKNAQVSEHLDHYCTYHWIMALVVRKEQMACIADTGVHEKSTAVLWCLTLQAPGGPGVKTAKSA